MERFPNAKRAFMIDMRWVYAIEHDLKGEYIKLKSLDRKEIMSYLT